MTGPSLSSESLFSQNVESGHYNENTGENFLKIIKSNTILNCNSPKMLSLLSDESVDLILTDPPYGIGFVNGLSKNKRKLMNDASTNDIDWPKTIAECVRVLKHGCCLCLCCRTDMLMSIGSAVLSSGLRYAHELLWVKGDMGYGNLAIMGSTSETIVVMSKGAPTRSSELKVDGVMKHRTPALYYGKLKKWEYLGHPTQKPLGLMAYVIASRTTPGALVVDPFCGSGTVLQAAKLLGRHYCGSDIDREFYLMARSRIKNKTLSRRYQAMLSNGLSFTAGGVFYKETT